MLKESKLYAESWNVAWRKSGTGTILEDIQSEFTVIKNGYRYWAADPFVFEYNGDTYIFAELYDYIRRRGILGYCKIDSKSEGKWKPVIVEKYHLSYPCIFCEDNEIYIMPEANASGELYLYRALNFPDKWEKSKVFRSDVKYADTTPLVYDGVRKALTLEVTDPYRPKLMLIDLEQSENDYSLHLPIIERRRSAGNVFEYKGKKIRPAQDCVEDYGKGVIFYEYSITPNGEYQEKELLELKPEQLTLSRKLYIDGMHTYNCSERFEVIDIKTRRFNILNFIFRIIGKVL